MKQYYIGVMSGTSLDGVDLALMDFDVEPAQCVATDFTPMPTDLKQALGQLLKSGETSLQQLGELDHRLGLLYAECINRFLAKQQLSSDQIKGIGCHGQTVWHSPTGKFPFTTQIGDMHLVAVKTSITTVGDFRRKDMAYGGQGAPLVPAFHQSLFSDPHKIIGILNIGGISNISLMIPNQATIGYDLGAGNTLLDIWIEQHLGKSFDRNGEWAKAGKVHFELLNCLLDEPFLKQSPPKSTGRELFNLTWLNQKLAGFSRISPQDVQAALLEFTAQSIALDLNNLQVASHLKRELLVCGGGAKNGFLMERLANLLPTWRISTTLEYGLDVDYVEAAAFAWLAYRRINNLPSNLPSVTGATQAVSLGAIFTN